MKPDLDFFYSQNDLYNEQGVAGWFQSAGTSTQISWQKKQYDTVEGAQCRAGCVESGVSLDQGWQRYHK